jgi:hypothetical protein
MIREAVEAFEREPGYIGWHADPARRTERGHREADRAGDARRRRAAPGLLSGATKAIAQGMGCGPATPGDTGTTIVPAQPKHAPVTGLFVANQFGAERLDTVMVTVTEAELCIPSSVD